MLGLCHNRIDGQATAWRSELFLMAICVLVMANPEFLIYFTRHFDLQMRLVSENLPAISQQGSHHEKLFRGFLPGINLLGISAEFARRSR